MARSSRKRKRRRNAPIGCLVWVTALLALAVVFVATRASLARAVADSGLARLLGLGVAAPPSPGPAAALDSPETGTPPPLATPPSASLSPDQPPETGAPSTPPRRTDTAPPPQPGREAAGPPAAAKAPQGKTRQSTLYFVKVSDDGGIALVGLTRPIAVADAPLTQTLEALVAGPLPAEDAEGYRSLIPAGTRIEDVYVEGRTAFVSFNEPFRFNTYGRDGLDAQLRQVVYTVTEFDNVDNVQLMIGGKVTDFLGPEGIRIREPLSRTSLTNGRL